MMKNRVAWRAGSIETEISLVSKRDNYNVVSCNFIFEFFKFHFLPIF